MTSKTYLNGRLVAIVSLYIIARMKLFKESEYLMTPVSVPAFVDMSSCLFSEDINVKRYDFIYACAQKL